MARQWLNDSSVSHRPLGYYINVHLANYRCICQEVTDGADSIIKRFKSVIIDINGFVQKLIEVLKKFHLLTSRAGKNLFVSSRSKIRSDGDTLGIRALPIEIAHDTGIAGN